MNARSVAPHGNGGLNVAFVVDDGCVGEGGVFAVFVDCVNAETVDAFFQPEVDCALVDCLAGGFVIPV